MVLYLVEVELPSGSAEAFERHAAAHVAKAVAAMGRGSRARRARVVREGNVQYVAVYELPDVAALESYLTSRDGLDLAGETTTTFPDARITHRWAEQQGASRRGMRHGEEPGAAFVVLANLPLTDAEAWAKFYDDEHIPEVLRERCFVKARRYKVHDEDDGGAAFLVLYEAVDLASVEDFRRDAGPRLAAEHEKRFPSAKLERQVWHWL